MVKQEFNKGEIVIYKTSKNEVKLDVRLKEETVWLTQKQIAILFDTRRPAITKHFNNIFKSEELDKNSVSSILEHTAADGKTYKTQFYNLDAIISVGYRVNSKRATQFRIWATKTLTLLEQYDKEKISLVKKAKGKFVLKYEDAAKVIQEIKKELLAKKEASDLFGQENGEKFQAI
ncbi:virulence RhuM family protein [Patescibacteria group bacterium]|nr:virulence RhuM family protein [Patescibacteria group bacterium]MBU4481565.1 virulence RhuM family protein [Patescibacteria group bacterium]